MCSHHASAFYLWSSREGCEALHTMLHGHVLSQW